MQISLIELSFSSPAIKTSEIRVKNSYNDVAQRKSLIGYHDHSREDKTSHAVTNNQSDLCGAKRDRCGK